MDEDVARFLDLVHEKEELKHALSSVEFKMDELRQTLPPSNPIPGSASLSDVFVGGALLLIDLVYQELEKVEIIAVDSMLGIRAEHRPGWTTFYELALVGIVPGETGNWSNRNVCFPDKPYNLKLAVSWLQSLGAAELIVQLKDYIRRTHGDLIAESDEVGGWSLS